MLSIDSNILFFAFARSLPQHQKALTWIRSIGEDSGVGISEFVLVELYTLVRNPVLASKPLTAAEAVRLVDNYRKHPVWRITGFPETSERLHTQLWKIMATPQIAYRRVYDTRFALSLRHFGVTHLATANVKHFQDFGFEKVWNPLAE